ncbi:disease resistance protein RML1A-like [Sesbania bispinosa]|nr:disease resistance protein RML1A-like [Sesbania bispinosa]
MSKTGDSFVPQMDAKAMRAFSRAGKRKQNLGTTTGQSATDNKGDHEVSSTTISDKPAPKKDKLRGDLNNCKKEKETSDILLKQTTTSLKETSDKLKDAEEKLAAEQVGRKTDTNNLKAEISFQYEVGFEKAVGQIKFLYPDLKVDEVGPFKEIKDGELVEIPDDEE